MAKLVEYDVEGVETSQGGTGVKIKPGVTPARIERCMVRETKKDGSKANDLEVVLNVGSEYDWVFTYIGLSKEADWKLAEFIRALGLKDKGKFDPDKMVGKVIRVKINPGEYGGEYSPQAGRLMPALPGDEEIIGESVSEMSSTAAASGPDEDQTPSNDSGVKVYSDPNFVASRENVEGSGPYDEWSDEDLIAEVSDRDLALAGGRGAKRDKAIAALRAEDAELAGGGGGEESPDDATAVGGTPADDYDSWSPADLKAEWEKREMGDLPTAPGRGAAKVDAIKAQMAEALRADDAEDPFA